MQTPVIAILLLATVASAHFGAGLFKDLNEKQKEELKAILHNQDLTRAQTKEQVTAWVAKQDEKVQKAFADAEKRKEAHKKEHEEKHKEKFANASEAAKKVGEELAAVWKNEGLTKKQTCQQINDVITKASEEVKKELDLKVHDCDKPWAGRGGRAHRHHKGGEQQQKQE